MTSRHQWNYRASRLERLRLFAFGQRCELHKPGTKVPCGRRAVGRYVLAQEFGTVQANLCLVCLDLKLTQIMESEWGQYEAQRKIGRSGLPVAGTWKTVLKVYQPSWLGVVLMWVGLDH